MALKHFQMSLSALILTVATLHLGIVGMVMAVKHVIHQRNQYLDLYQVVLDVPDPDDVFIGYPPSYMINEGAPVGDSAGGD